MSDQHQDPSGNTQAFRAFATGNEQPAEPPAKSNLPLVISIGAAAVIAVIVAVVLLLL